MFASWLNYIESYKTKKARIRSELKVGSIEERVMLAFFKHLNFQTSKQSHLKCSTLYVLLINPAD